MACWCYAVVRLLRARIFLGGRRLMMDQQKSPDLRPEEKIYQLEQKNAA